MFELTSRLLNNLGYIIALAFFFTKFKRARNIFTKKEYTKLDIILLSIFFSFLSIIGTYTGIYYRGAIVNTRNIGVAVAGIIGGPQVGIITGCIAGIHRFFIDTQSPTTIACGISSIIGGFITTLFFRKTNEKNCYIYGFISGFLIENLSMILILITGFFLYNFNIAIDIVKNIYIPMILANALGVSIVIIIIEDLISEKEILAGKQAKLALEIANKSLPYIRKGNSLNEVCKIILEALEAKMVIITDDKNIIASSVISDEYVLNHSKIKSKATKQVLKTGEFLILGKDEDDLVDFQYISENIKSCIILPLFQEERKISGTLKLYFDTTKSATARKQYLAEGLSMLISTQIELSNIENFKSMAKEAELKALQTQINPHFLFNALHTISSFVRIEPNKAREIIINLSTYLRYNLENFSKLLPLHEELQQVEAYINIEKARFGNKIKTIYNIPESSLTLQLPSLIIQPLVENSIKHGILKRREGGTVTISVIEKDKSYNIIIEDDGIGIDQSIIDGIDDKIEKNIGLKNVHNRLKILYGKGLNIEKLEKGTRISFNINKEEKC
ncbi:MAG: histidine kinase [Candidatus Fusobacterium pullicola]|uniref:histidine kinase n=1 Tax=Candidatus Fusobacterium pullicola TaxID=2838601 RepID=A0A9E2NXL2_9FUSO|nr:histidine kinase [Fusobacterium mortiferum]MBU3842532.1 histidine kinase [Candidatus Fusobacterium pullicola]